MIYYVKAKGRGAAASKTRNYCDVYFEEFFSLLGCTATPVAPDKIPQGEEKCGSAALFLGSGDFTDLSGDIAAFAESGGTVIALGSRGIAKLCGMREVGTVRADTPFTVNGHLLFDEKIEMPYNRLPVVADIVHCRPLVEGEMPVEIVASSQEYDGIPLVFTAAAGRGKIVYFTFSLLQTIWYKTQGKPVTRDSDGDGYMRSGDSIIVDRTDNYLFPAVDVYLRYIEDLLFECCGAPLLHRIPADGEGNPCDYALYFAGDEDLCGEQMFEANDELRSRGIPYHVHLQPKDYKGFSIDAQTFNRLREQGLDLSLHFDFITNKTYRYDYESLLSQVELYKREFGELPTVCNKHWIIYNGFGETAHWYKKLGLTATFRQLGINADFADINKMNDYGFAYGTSYPTQAMDDRRYGYKPTGIYELKMTFYEPRIREKADVVRIDEFMKITDEMALTANIFIHPVYLVEDKSAVLPAVDRILKATEGKRVAKMYSTQLIEWWRARAASTLKTRRKGEYEADFKAPLVIKCRPDSVVTVDGAPTEGYRKTIAGRKTLLVAVPQGKHTVGIALK